MRKRILFIILASLFFLGAVTFYINQVIIPKHLKTVITPSVEKLLGRKIALSQIRFNPLRGFVIDGIVIYEKDSDDIFATIDYAAAGLRYIPLIFHKKIVLSSFETRRVQAHLIHYASDQWNYTDLIERLGQRKSSSSPKVPVYLSRLEMTNANIKVTDLEAGSQNSEFFENINLKAELSLSRGILFQFNTAIPKQGGWIEGKGRYHLLTKKFKGFLKLKNIPLAQYVKLAKISLPVSLTDLYVNDAQVMALVEPQNLDIQGMASVKNLHVMFSPEQVLLANLVVMQKGRFTLHNGKAGADGVAWAKDIQVTDGLKNIAASNIQAELYDLDMERDTFLARIKGQILKPSYKISGQPFYEGEDLIFDHIRLSHKDTAWTTSGSLVTHKAVFDFKPEIKLTGDFDLPSFEFMHSPTAVTAKGRAEGEDIFFQWPPGKQLTGNVVLKDFSLNGSPDQPWTAQTHLTGKSLMVQWPSGQTFSTDVESALSVKVQTGELTKVDVAADYKGQQSTLALKSGINFHGNPAGKVEVHSSGKPDEPAAYQGAFDLTQAVAENTRIGAIENISGTIDFKNNEGSSQNLNFHALGMDGSVKGRLENFTQPWVDVKIHVGQFDLTKTPRIATAFCGRHQLTLDGTAENADISYKGLISNASNADIRFNAMLKEASARSAKFNQGASELTGQVDYKRDHFSWKNLKANYGGRSYVLTGRLTDFSHPQIDTTLASNNLKLTTRLDYTPELTTIKKLTGIYEHMEFDVKGTSHPSGDGRPLLDLTGAVDVDLKHLPALIPHWEAALEPYQLSGIVKIKGDFHGDPVHWQDWQYNLTGSSSQMFLRGLKMRNVRFNVVQKDSRIKPCHLWANLYSGNLNAIASFDAAQKELPFDLIIKIEDTDLNELKEDTPFKKNNIDGKLSLTALFEGTMTDAKNFTGKGGIQIEKGRLWEIDLLKGLGGILLIPEYKDIVFEEAGMNFELKDRKVTTDNLQLISTSLTMYGRGSLDFDQNLNLVLTPDFNNAVIAGSSSLKKGSTAIIAQTEQFMSVNVTGTLSHPQYKVNKSPGRILQKTGGIILESVSSLLKNIF